MHYKKYAMPENLFYTLFAQRRNNLVLKQRIWYCVIRERPNYCLCCSFFRLITPNPPQIAAIKSYRGNAKNCRRID